MRLFYCRTYFRVNFLHIVQKNHVHIQVVAQNGIELARRFSFFAKISQEMTIFFLKYSRVTLVMAVVYPVLPVQNIWCK